MCIMRTMSAELISIGMEPEDGIIWVYGISEDAIMAFIDEGIEELKNLLEIPTYSRNHRRLRPTADGYNSSSYAAFDMGCSNCRNSVSEDGHRPEFSKAIIGPSSV